VARGVLEDVCSQLADARVKRMQFAQALPYVKQVLELNPTNAPVRAALGLIHLKTGQFAEAVPELEEALRLNPNLSAARYNLACAYSRVGRLAEAYEMLKILFSSQPRFIPGAARDIELGNLRDDPVYAERFRTLVGGAGIQ